MQDAVASCILTPAMIQSVLANDPSKGSVPCSNFLPNQLRGELAINHRSFVCAFTAKSICKIRKDVCQLLVLHMSPPPHLSRLGLRLTIER